jgi:serine/threonine-protein kinase
VIHILKQICGSIAEAHAAGLIHRDLKPANVMLCERGGIADFVKVLDFGLVRQQKQSPDLALTDINSLTGTPLYMPPEAVDAPDKLDARGDLYQIGAIGYYLLVGRHLFTGSSMIEILGHHMNTAPTPPSEALGRPVNAVLEAVLLRCLAKAPDDRPGNAAELLLTLEGISDVPAWSQAEAIVWWREWWEDHPDWQRFEHDSASLPSAASVDIHGRLQDD